MRFAHLADLHLGKSLNHYSLVEDQEYILDEVCRLLKENPVDAVLLAGDIYDRPVPPADAVNLLNRFLTRLNALNLEVFVIAGNHDSGDRLNFASDLLSGMHLHIQGTYSGVLNEVTLQDDAGPVHIYSLPFIRPSSVNRYLPEEEERITSYTEAVRYVLSHTPINTQERNVLLSHQFVTGACVDEKGSEEFEIGGLDNIDASVFAGFSYVALGHIHRPQNIDGQRIRYSGTPLAYSFGELKQEKSLTIVDLSGDGSIHLDLYPLVPKRKLSQIRGTFEEVMDPSFITQYQADYLRVILTDEMDIPDAANRLKAQYPYLMGIEYDNQRTRNETLDYTSDAIQEITPLEHFQKFFALQNGREMNEAEQKLAEKEIREVFEEVQE